MRIALDLLCGTPVPTGLARDWLVSRGWAPIGAGWLMAEYDLAPGVRSTREIRPDGMTPAELVTHAAELARQPLHEAWASLIARIVEEAPPPPLSRSVTIPVRARIAARTV